jgi:hypothetical protein
MKSLNNNVCIEQFPGPVMAKQFGFKQAAPLEFDATEVSDLNTGTLFS